jgi:hypothetical protein
MRSVVDVRALSPTDKLSWLEYCKPQTTENFVMMTSTEYVDCELEKEIMPVAKNAVATGYVSGIAGPVLQSGAIVGGAALLGNGIRQSGSSTVNNNSMSGGSSNASNTNRNTNRNDNSNVNDNTSSNTNTNTATGGNGNGNSGNGNSGNGNDGDD